MKERYRCKFNLGGHLFLKLCGILRLWLIHVFRQLFQCTLACEFLEGSLHCGGGVFDVRSIISPEVGFCILQEASPSKADWIQRLVELEFL